METLKLIGAAWLIYLGRRALLRHRSADLEATSLEPSAPRTGGRVARLGEGGLVGVTNPKGIATFAALAPSAVHRAHGQIDGDVVLLGVAGITVAVLCDGAWALGSGTARSWLGSGRRRALDLAAGALMIGFGIGLAAYTLA